MTIPPRSHLHPALAALALSLLPSPAAAQAPVATHLAALDLRVARLGERLAIAAVPLCRTGVARTGLDLHSRAQYGQLAPSQEREMFAVADGVAILLTVPGSPADRAGVRPGDGLVAIDGVRLATTPPGRRPDYAPTLQALNQLDAAMADGQAILHLRDGRGGERDLHLTGEQGCPSRFQMAPGGGLDAEADGTYVKIGQGMVEATDDDDVLAASLAHELAHNILRHRDRQNAAGIRRGLARMFGRNAALSRAAEIEADRLVPWLLARAGHDPAAALRWLDLLEQRVGLPAPTHPSWSRRRQIINDQLPLIAAQIAAGRDLAPPFDTINPGPIIPDSN